MAAQRVRVGVVNEHKIIEAMGTSWDVAGHRPPWKWHVECTCGWYLNGLRDQDAAYDAWQLHRQAVIEQEGGGPS